MAIRSEQIEAAHPYGGVEFENVIPLEDYRNLEHLTHYVDWLKEGAEFKELHYLGADNTKEGTIHRYGIVTEAGYAYNGNISIPKRQTSDIAVLKTCAWGTSPRGHNEHTDRVMMQDGYPAITLGNEGSYRPKKLPMPERPLTLGGTAAVALNFSRFAGAEFSHIIHPTDRTAKGESKGGMEGMGYSLDRNFGQNVLMIDFTAPCIPKKFQLTRSREFGAQLVGKEPLELARLGGRLALGLVFHYPATVDPHPYAVIHQIAKSPAVFSGEAGDLGRLMNSERIMHITTFKDDAWSMPDVWEEIFPESEYPNVRITRLEGSHLTLADPETLAYIRARERAFRELYTQNGNSLFDKFGNELITGDMVFDLAHGYVDQYRAPRPEGVVNKVVRFIFRDCRINQPVNLPTAA